jgi:hypothetical protein
MEVEVMRSEKLLATAIVLLPLISVSKPVYAAHVDLGREVLV